MGRELFPVAGPLDDDLVAGVGQPVQGAVAQDGVIEEAEPFLHGPVAGDDEAGDPVSADDQLVEVGGLLAGEPVEAQVAQDEQTSLYPPVGAATRLGDLGVEIAMRDQKSTCRPGRRPGPS